MARRRLIHRMTFPTSTHYRERMESLRHYYRGDYVELGKAVEDMELTVQEHAEAPVKGAELYAELWVELSNGKLHRLARALYVQNYAEGNYVETTFYLPSREYPYEIQAPFQETNEWWKREGWN